MTDRSPSLVDFLDGLGLPDLVAKFQAEDIDMSVLPLLEPSDLVELGLSLGQRKKLQAGLAVLADAAGTERPDAPDDARIQLRRLSVLFCDMVGSTDLGERLSIDEMQDLLSHYYAIARRIARDHGGHIATVQGDGVIMLFGFPRVFDGTAARCLQAALAFQAALAAEPARIFGQEPVAIRTRIGVATGKAAVGQPDGSVPGGAMHLVGPVVNRAARLQTLAGELCIAVDERTREQTEDHFAFSEPEMTHLKGLHQDVAVSRLLSHLRHHRKTAEAARPLVGRDAELARLAGMWDRVRAGTPVCATITGDAGVGKSALARAFLSRLEPAAAHVMRLHGSPLAEQNALWPVVEYLGDDAEGDEAVERSHWTVALNDLLARSDPDLARSVAGYLGLEGHGDGTGQAATGHRAAVLALLAGWITGISGRPTVLVLENAHWSDHTTRELMAACAAAAVEAPAPVLMLALSRAEDEDIWSAAAPSETIALNPLVPAAAEALLDLVVAGHPLPTSVRQNILRHSDGNPLMIETLGHSHEDWHAADLVKEIDVPVTIYETVSKRLDAIRSGQLVIEALSVLNGPTETRVLAAVVGRPENDLPPALAALERAGLIVSEGPGDAARLRIRHQVYRDVIYEQITGQSRQKLHQAAYSALRDHDDTIETTRPDILALHAQAAQDQTSASVHALEAGDKLLRRSALIEASYFFKLALSTLEHQPDDPTTDRKRLRAVTGLASVERSRFGIATDASGELGRKAAQLARALGDNQAEMLAFNGLYAHALVRADYRLAQDHAERLLAAARAGGNRTFEMIGTRAIGVVAFHRGDFATSRDRLETALGQYDREKHLPLTHAHGYDHAEICAAFLSFTHWMRGDPVAARRISDFSVSHSRDIDHAHSLGQAMAFRVMLGALARDRDGLVAVGPEVVELGDKYDLRVMRTAGFLFPFASKLCVQEDAPGLQDMDELQNRVSVFRKANPFNYGPLTATVFAAAALRAGLTDLAETTLRTGREIEEQTGETWTSPELARLRARCLAARGQSDAAHALRRDAYARASAGGSVMLALRIACDMAEDRPDAQTAARVAQALSRVLSDDGGWDMRRAKALS